MSAGCPPSRSRPCTMPKRTSRADATPVRVCVVTMDSHLASASARAAAAVRKTLPGLTLSMHAADEWGTDKAALDACLADIARADIVVAAMLFMEDHIRPVLPALAARRDSCDAMICLLSAGEVMRLTRAGRFSMAGEAGGALAMLKRVRGSKDSKTSSGRDQMKMLRRLPQILRFIPGTAQDVRAYFLALQYWLAGSEENLSNMLRLLIARYAAGPRRGLQSLGSIAPPIEYPEVGVYHPGMKSRFSDTLEDLPSQSSKGTVG